MSFTALLEDLENLQKAMKKPSDEQPEDGDEKILDASPDEAIDREQQDRLVEKKKDAPKKDEEKDEGKEKDEEEDEDKEKDEGEEGEMFGKSFSITLEDGTQTEAYDATAIMKSFDDRITQTEKLTSVIDELKSQIEALRLSLQESAMEKAIAVQTDLIKSLSEQIGSLRKEGVGRKSVLNVHEKPTAGMQQVPMTPNNEDLLNKAQIAMEQKRLSAFDVSRIETYLGRGLPLPADLMRRLT